MYEYNTLEAKIRRVKEIQRLRERISRVSAKYLSYEEARTLGRYLEDLEEDLSTQVKKQQERKEKMIKEKVRLVNKAIVDHWGTREALKLWEELEKCQTDEEIAQLYDKYNKPA